MDGAREPEAENLLTIDPEELWQGRALIETLGREGELSAVAGEPPEPDVIGLDHAGVPVLGIEVTEIHPGGKDGRHVEGALGAILRGVATAHDSAGRSPVLVSIIFTPHFRPTKAERREVVEQIVSVIAAKMPSASGVRVSLDSLAEDRPWLPDGIDSMNIQLVDATESFAHAPAFAFVPDISASDIGEALERKEPKPRNYRGAYRERCLLLVASGAGPSTWGRFSPELLAIEFESTFDRIFVMNRLQVAFHELQRRPPSQGAV